MKISQRALSTEADGIPGFVAHPRAGKKGPGLLIVHHHYGVTGHMKSMACDFAEQGYTTVVPDLYGLLGFSDYHDVQKKTTDGNRSDQGINDYRNTGRDDGSDHG